MRLSRIGELTLLKDIRKRFGGRSGDIIVGIGDDAAVIKSAANKKVLLTTDMMSEGIHFDLGFVTPFQLGHKLVSVNVSDIYAMGGRPKYLLLDISAGRSTSGLFIERFLDGVAMAIKKYGVALVGGDISSSKTGLTIAATLLGECIKPVRRSGAKPGDRLYVTGKLGDSACGLKLLKKIKMPFPLQFGDNQPEFRGKQCLPSALSKLAKLGLTLHIVRPLLERHLMPEARDPKKFVRHITSMIDISDGLLIDISRLCEEGAVGAKIYVKQIPISSYMKRVASALCIDPLRLALAGGEDYELLFTAPASQKIEAVCIGEITKTGRIIVGKEGTERTFLPEGYQHFANKNPR